MPTNELSRVLSCSMILAGLCVVGCGAPVDDEAEEEGEVTTTEAALVPGVNGSACAASPFNCKLRAHGGNAVNNSKGGLWAVDDAAVVDGNGDAMCLNTRDHLRFNYGQTRHMKGKTYVYARSTSCESSGWFPIDGVAGEASLRKKVGEVNAKDTGDGDLGCYKIKSSHDAGLVEKKVVFDSEETHERAGDYLPLPRANGKRYANLAFNVPGFGLGGPAIDIYPSGQKFQRVDVPTDTGKPSITIPLWVKDGDGRYRKQSGTLTFIYGYVMSDLGTKRFGWMALPALVATTGCK